jgi:hypothetical protein
MGGASGDEMAFLILGKNILGKRGSPDYRGTYRESIPYGDGMPDDSEYNILFRWYVDAEASGDVTDGAKAQRLLTILHRDFGRREFELVEATRLLEEPRIGGEFLGYDLSHALSYSLLSWGLDFSTVDKEGTLPVAVSDLLGLLGSHFRPLLNKNGLFSDKKMAEFCLRSMIALQQLFPGLWENEESSNFEVVAIYIIADTRA